MNYQILFALLTMIINICHCQSYPTFDQYVHDFQKNYPNQEERIKRQQIYQNRLVFFQTIADYTPGVNNFTDWTQQEINALKNYSPPRADQSQNQSNNKQSNGILSVSTPQSLDWRTTKAVTSVKTQGLCGACWAFSVTAYVESKLIIQQGYGIAVDLSQQYLVSCTTGSNCTGGYAQDAMQLVAKSGIPYESSFPYDPFGSVSPNICSTQNKVTDAGNKARWLRNVTDSTIINLLQNGPVSISISADNWEYYNGGVFTCPSNSTVNHAVLLVGYTSSYWIAKNQWGRTWGESGYIRVARSRNNSYTNCYIGNLVVYMDPVQASTNYSHLIKFVSLIMMIAMIIIIV